MQIRSAQETGSHLATIFHKRSDLARPHRLLLVDAAAIEMPKYKCATCQEKFDCIKSGVRGWVSCPRDWFKDPKTAKFYCPRCCVTVDNGYSRLRSENHQLRRGINQLRSEKDQLGIEKNQLRSERDQLGSEKDQLRRGINQLRSERDQFRSENDQLRNDKSELNKELTVLQKRSKVACGEIRRQEAIANAAIEQRKLKEASAREAVEARKLEEAKFKAAAEERKLLKERKQTEMELVNARTKGFQSMVTGLLRLQDKNVLPNDFKLTEGIVAAMVGTPKASA